MSDEARPMYPSGAVKQSAPALRRVRPEMPRLALDRMALGQLVVMLVAGTVLSVAIISIAVINLFAMGSQAAPVYAVQLGPLTTYVSAQMPVLTLILVSLTGIAAVAIAAVTLEVGATLLTTLSPRRRSIAAFRESRRHAEVGAPVHITVVIPAYDEEASIGATLDGLAAQERVPDRILVVADNCTDKTALIATERGCEVFETVNNRNKKAGALNQALSVLLRTTGPDDAILVLDADTVLMPGFIEAAAGELEADPEMAAVGARFWGGHGAGILGQFQRNEFLRYSAQISARRGRVFVLTGTATLFRADALLDVAAARGVYIPGQTGQVYDTAALTEDNEITLALKSLGAQITSPDECEVVTEIMPTVKMLWRQRKRWQRGALENLSGYGITASTVRYWGQQFGIGYGIVALFSAIVFMVVTALSVAHWVWFPFWMAVTAVFIIERTITAWHGGWGARILAISLVPELAYAIFLQVVFIKCLLDITFSRAAAWSHVGEGVTS